MSDPRRWQQEPQARSAARMPPEEEIRRAAEILRAGGLVAFPTETVYGLGANALDSSAVRRIYEVKGRPATSPLIVHVCSVRMAQELAGQWPPEAEDLVQAFWPGPLTLVLPKQPIIPEAVTAGLPTVGLRMPASVVALKLIEAAGVPLAAPSANPFGGLSPTRAEHVRAGLGNLVDYVLDGGSCDVGIESTVLSLAVRPPVLLRPGMVSRDQIEALIGPVSLPGRIEGSHPSPGLHSRHYSPRTPLVLITDESPLPPGSGAYVFYDRARSAACTVTMPADPRAYAARLYDVLHELDAARFEWIAVEAPPDDPSWQGVHDRLLRAAARPGPDCCGMDSTGG